MPIAGLLLAILIGASLGLLGGGGSILAVPILVYAVGMTAKPAIAVSLLVVGVTSLIGALRHWRTSNVDPKTAVAFGLVSMAGSYGGGKLAAQLSDRVQLTIFAAVMLAAAVSMFRSKGEEGERAAPARLPLVIAAAAGVGLLTGVVGVGGGFLIVPALVLFGGLTMKRAVGTSLLVIAMNSVSGFLAYAGEVRIDWAYTMLFTALAVAGVFLGSALAQHVSPAQLRRGFAVFLVAVSTFVLAQNALTSPAHAAPHSRAKPEVTPTVVVVRAVSRDAKVLGDAVGGARITIRDAATGKVLATGIQTGGTGDTKRIMQEPRVRGSVVYGTESAAAYRATLDLAGPTRVEITAEGPLKYPQAMQRASKTMLLLPGQNVEGEGVLLEIAGFIVDLPPLAAVAGQPVTIRAKVTMTCGCPTEPGGLWNADEITVTARVLRGATVVTELALPYAGQTSTYEAQAGALEPGTYTVEVLASDAGTANFARAVAELVVPAS